jgi:transglutaminase-like putative cysteine protease
MTRLFLAGRTGDTIVLASVLSALVAWFTRRVRAPALLAFAITLAGLFWFVAVRFFPHTLIGPFPGPRTLGAIFDAAHEGARQINDEVAPVQPTSQLLMFVAMGAWVTTWLVDTAALAIGNAMLSVASALPLFIVPGGLVVSRRLGVETAIFLAAACWLVYAIERERIERTVRATAEIRGRRVGWRAGTAARIAIIGGVIVALLTPSLPGFGGTPLFRSHRGAGPGVRFNPLVAIKPTLDHSPGRDLFVVRSSIPMYYRLTALDEFDGKVWKQSDRKNLVPLGQGDNVLGASSLPGATKIVRQEFEMLDLAGPWLPAAYEPAELSGAGRAHFDADTSTLLVDDGVHQGLRYTVTSVVPNVSLGDLDENFTYDTRALAHYLQVPRGLPRVVSNLARDIARDASNPVRKAVALQEYLRRFTYDEDVAAGHNFNDIVEFLTKTKRGYCEQFAASMAVMARSLGLPARVVIGFANGERFGVPGQFRVNTRHAHAWVEVYFPQAGWLTFEPTPRAGITTVPAYTIAPRVQPTVEPSASPQPSASASSRTGPEENAPGAGGSGGIPTLVLVAAAVVALALLVAGALVAMRKRKRRTLAAAPPREAVAARYVSFLAWCAATGYGRRTGETPREHAARIGATVEPARTPLAELAALAETALWAPPDPLDASEAEGLAERSRAALSEPLPRHRRLRGLVRVSR